MSFVDNPHNNHHLPNQHKFWCNTVSNPELLKELNSSNAHHIGDLYRKNGMKINLGDLNSEEARRIKSIIQFIKGRIGNAILLKIKAENDKLLVNSNGEAGNKERALGQNEAQGNLSQVQHQKIIFFGREFNKSLNPRSITEPDLLEENYIKAIAVSILAETNGNSKMAESVLTNGGLQAIKQLDIKDLRNLLGELQSGIQKENIPQKE